MTDSRDFEYEQPQDATPSTPEGDEGEGQDEEE